VLKFSFSRRVTPGATPAPARSCVLLFLGILLLHPDIPLSQEEPDEGPSAPLPQLQHNAQGMRDSLYQRGVEYLLRYTRDDMGQAVRLFGYILKADKDFAPAYGGLAEARSLRYFWGWEPDPERLKQAMSMGEKGVELGPESADAHLGLGLALMASERYTPALAEMDRAVALAPDSFRAHLYRGMILRGLRRNEDLAKEASRLVGLDPSSAAAYSLLGDYYQDTREFLLARDSYLTAALLDQRLFWPRLGLAASYQKRLNLPSAGKSYDAAIRDFPEETVRCRIMWASLLVAGQNYEDALKIYQELPEREALSPPLMRRLMLAGRAYSLEKLGGPEKAEYFWTQLVQEFPEKFDGAIRDREVVSQGYEGLVRYYDGKGEKTRSRELLESAGRHEGMTFSLYRNLAERRAAAGDSPGAVAALRKGVRGAPPGLDLVDASNSSLAAIRGLGDAGGKTQVRTVAGELLDELSTRLSHAPNTGSYTPHLLLARGEALLGREARAIEHLRQALSLGYSGTRSLATDPDFKSLRDNPDFRALTKAP
jgi:tetratricopeptide (TPR) repeat protein